MELFVKIRREKFLGRANVTTKQSDSVHTICCECNVPFKVGEAFLTADKLPNKFWHPSCFMCSKCKELLIEMIYFVHEGKLYCGRDHAEQLKPRCAACDEIIFCSEYTRAEDQNWHVNHFCCHRCDNYLGGKNYMASKEGQPYCLSCYEIKFANICVACGSTIPLDEPLLKHNDSYWHAKPDCFKCYVCKKSLVDQPFLPKHNVVFCSKECFREFKKRGL
jgi:prickle